PHPSAYGGACIRREFAPGAIVLFFLDRRDGEWVPAGGAFSRWAEDLADVDAPWLQLTRFYARVAALPDGDRAEALEDERDALLARIDEPVAQAMGADIARQLDGPSALLRAELLPAPPAPPAAKEDDGWRKPGDITSVQQALDAMRAGKP
ncbi:MAG: hypothetical protein ABIT16_09000, partial [Croceibacterium sp.]